MAEKEWSENPEDDPIELQKQQVAMGKEFLDRLKKHDEEEAARKAECAEARPPGRYIGPVYKPPSFEEVSAVLKKAWDEVERIMPAAGDRVKAAAFQTLMQAAAPSPSYMV